MPYKKITISGITYKNQQEAIRAYGNKVSLSCFHDRLRRGWSVLSAVSTNVGAGIFSKDHLGKTYKSMSDMCKSYGIDHSTFLCRLNRGWSIEQALTKPVRGRKKRCA